MYIAALDAAGDIAPTVSLTSAGGIGSTFTAPATTTVAATASDADGTVTKVDFYANGVLIGTDTTSPYSVNWSAVPAGRTTLTAVATDDRDVHDHLRHRSVTVDNAVTSAERPNVALAVKRSAASRVVYLTARTYAAANAIDGDRKASLWGKTWADKTSSVFPDWLRIDFGASKTIDEIDVFSGQSNGSIEPTAT